MANITKKVSWSSRADDCAAAGEETPLLNGSEQPRFSSRQVHLASATTRCGMTLLGQVYSWFDFVYVDKCLKRQSSGSVCVMSRCRLLVMRRNVMD